MAGAPVLCTMTAEELEMTVMEFEMHRGLAPGTIKMGNLRIPDPRTRMRDVKESFEKPLEPVVPLNEVYTYERWKRNTDLGATRRLSARLAPSRTQL